METKILIAVTTAIAGIIGATIGAIAKNQNSRHKLNEIKFEYEKRLQEGYLDRARDYLKSVYIPLSIEVTKLNASFLSFREKPSVKAENKRFKSSIKEFITTVDSLGEVGANAFYTTELDETLQSFREFLGRAVYSEDVKTKAVIKISYDSFFLRNTFEHKQTLVMKGAKKALLKGDFSANFIGFPTITYQINELLEAPLDSKEFEERFVTDVGMIKILVKEVTLGANARKK